MHSEPRLIHLLTSNRWNGVARCVLDISRYFKSAGWNVTVYTRDARMVDEKFRDYEISLRHAPLRGFMDPTTIRIMAADMRHEPPGTVVHVHRFRDAFTALAARKLAARKDIGIVVTSHKVRPGRDNWLLRRIYRNVKTQIFPSRIALETFLSTWKDDNLPMKSEKNIIVRDSVIAGNAVPEPEKGPKTILFCGYLHPGRGLEVLIDALPFLKGKRARLAIAGYGNSGYIDTLRHRAMKIGVMEMIDWKKGGYVAEDLIRESHIGVLPSIIPEASGMFAIECMASGRPVVCTNNGGCAEYISNGVDGLLVPPDNPKDLADALLLLLDDSEKRRKMGVAARKKFEEQLSWRKFVSRLTTIYNA